ncbi:kinesin [Sphingomonas sp. M1A8_2b]
MAGSIFLAMVLTNHSMEDGMTNELEKRIEALEAALTKAEDEKKAALGEKFKATTALRKLQDDQESAIEDAKAATGTELEKALNEIKKLTKQVNDLTGERDTFASDLKTIRVDNEVKSAIAAANIRPELVPAIEALLLRNANYEDGAATIDGKSIGDHAKSFFKSKEGSYFVRAPESSGSGATGNDGAVANTFAKPPVTDAEWNTFDRLANDDPAMRNSLADKWNLPDLKV